jgi:hypothetical protein
MKISGQQVIVRNLLANRSPLESLKSAIDQQCGSRNVPIRLGVVGRNRRGHVCEMEVISFDEDSPHAFGSSIFEFRRRERERTGAFNAVMLIPTGVDCAIGGHAGDATPSARVLASVCDHLILHPNVVNASDINEQTENCLYAEGSLICRLMMGTIGLAKVRQNRVLLVTEERPDAPNVVEQTINCAEGARATLGMDLRDIVVLEEGLHMQTGVSDSGRVTGNIGRMETLLDMLGSHRRDYDAIALATRITPHVDTVELHRSYFGQGGPNPWGGVEAILTHSISTALDVPSAHAPTMSSEALRNERWGVVEPRKAAETISTTYLFCVLKGLNRAPRVVTEPTGAYDPSVLTVEDVSCLVIPDGCVGLPTLAALEQGIPVIAVRNNTNLMRNRLSELPFAPGQLLFAENYFEAAGLMAALKSGIAPATVRRPIGPTRVTRAGAREAVAASNGHANNGGNGHAKPSANGHAKNGRNGHSKKVLAEVMGV